MKVKLVSEHHGGFIVLLNRLVLLSSPTSAVSEITLQIKKQNKLALKQLV